MSYTDLMIDLETLGTRPETGVPILSLGWCLWHARHPWPAEPASAQIFVRASPGKVDPMTQEWHETKNPGWSKLRAACDASPTALTEALATLGNLHRQHEVQRVWSHGSIFDVAILEYWYRALNLDAPWKFWDVCDTRTLFTHCGVRLPKNSHDAREDAVNQARLVHVCQTRLREALWPGTK